MQISTEKQTHHEVKQKTKMSKRFALTKTLVLGASPDPANLRTGTRGLKPNTEIAEIAEWI